MTVHLEAGERIDQLRADGVQIIQSSQVFSFSLDAVLLANFSTLPKRGQIVDLCSGNGAVGLFISAHTNAQIIGVEIQETLADMSRRSIQLNALEKQMSVLTLDLKEAPQTIMKDSTDLVICNPPYFKGYPASQKNPNPYLAVARHEIKTTLQEVVQTASQLLKMNGHFAMVHRPERLLEILAAFQHERIMPKRIRFVYPKQDREANILLIEGIKDGKPGGLRILPPLYVYDDDDNYLPEVAEMLYGG